MIGSAQIAAPSALNPKKRGHVMPSAPAIGGATSDTPGMKRPMTSSPLPQRPNAAPVFVTQLCGESESLQRRVSTRLPYLRPKANQTALPNTEPTTIAAVSCAVCFTTSDIAAPATSTVG